MCMWLYKYIPVHMCYTNRMYTGAYLLTCFCYSHVYMYIYIYVNIFCLCLCVNGSPCSVVLGTVPQCRVPTFSCWLFQQAAGFATELRRKLQAHKTFKKLTRMVLSQLQVWFQICTYAYTHMHVCMCRYSCRCRRKHACTYLYI